jgi:dipeptidyl aminopeptidase/acylaminoacyl peptidase
VERKAWGTWASPISPKGLGAARKVSDGQWDDATGMLLWVEGRGERSVLVGLDPESGEAPRELTGDRSVRAKVGYGGGDFAVGGGVAVFADAASGRLFRVGLRPGDGERPITPAFGAAAAPRISPDGRFVCYVHQDGDDDRLAIAPIDGGQWPQILASGRDFYAQPCWRPDGRQLAFVAWDHPSMPWVASTLYLASVDATDGALPRLAGLKAVAGGNDRAVFQPTFSSDGRTLYYVSDESGWSQLHALALASGEHRQVTNAVGCELGMPQWVQDMRTYVVEPDGRFALATVSERGFVSLRRIDLRTGDMARVAAMDAYGELSQPSLDRAGQRLAVMASSSRTTPRLVVVDAASGSVKVVARATGEQLAPEQLSQPEALTWTTAGGEQAHGLFYPPVSDRFTGVGRPPVIVLIHGGPTSQVRAGYSAQAQFFATRGYAVLAVNHRGSTGYGRAYMLRQAGAWGQVDVEDAVSGVRHLADTGRADGAKAVIMGGSAGGYTVLQAMVDQPEAFAAGIVMYGISNQFTLVATTHKFEAHYSDWLLGPLPEAADLYRQRSPVLHAARIKRPLAIFQGDADKVVPKDQSDAIVKALQQSHVRHEYHVYAGEGHGWRKPETVAHFYQAVDDFLKSVLVYA